MVSMMRAMLCVLQLLVLLEITLAANWTTAPAPVQPAVQCTSGDRNIEPLIKDGYWKVDIAKYYCSGPDSNCGAPRTLYMAFCQPLPANGIPGCDTSELGPTSLCITNGTVGYSIGAYDDSDNLFRYNGIAETRLMATFRNGSTDSMCLHSYLTTISFECNPHNVWEINGANVVDVTAYVIELSYFYYACNLFFRFGYSKLCKPAVCGSPQHDTTTLTSPDYWQVSIPEESCRRFFEGGGCTLYMSFCKQLSGIDHCNNFVNSSICITNGTTDYSLGSYNNRLNPFAGSDNETLLVAYNDSNQNPRCPSGNVGSIITFDCTKEAKWSESGCKGDAADYLIELLQNPEDPCLVFIELTYSGAYKMNKTSPDGESNGDLCGPSLLLIMLLIFSLAVF
ncbi:uncharacterized protein [Dysidea avara]|uniref:uncharacterized protein n=1 Tax=Dysidea avara TaxID=196820 RepID=UPI003326E17A